ncbi:hypothetical protein Tco_0733372 [Tanacetum coccineum]
MGYFQIIRADGSSKRYSSMIQMLQNIDREDLETLWKLVKAKHGLTRSEKGYERVLWGDLKVMFEPDVETENTCNNDKNLSEIQLEHEKEDELVVVVVKVDIEDGLLEEMEKFGWWFEQDNGGESEDDRERSLVMVSEEGWMS